MLLAEALFAYGFHYPLPGLLLKWFVWANLFAIGVGLLPLRCWKSRRIETE